jgi:hypothetical protein
MVDTVLTLGSFVFQNMEIPEDLNLGGEQSLNIHKLIGGQRVIDALGSDEGEISWEGLMLGSDAYNRALQLDSMRAQGQPLNFSVFSSQYNVVISKFSFSPNRFYNVNYKISLAVIQNLSVQTGITNIPSFNDQINADLTSANTIASATSIISLISSMTNLNNAVSAVPDFDTASQSDLNNVSVQISDTQDEVSSLISGIDSNITTTQ